MAWNWRGALLGFLLAAGLGLPAAAWTPSPDDRFDVQFAAPLRLDRPVEILDLDAVDTRPETITAQKAKGRHLVCYVSAGTFEDWRPDRDSFPKKLIGKPVDGWPGERWLDIRRIDLLRPLMRARVRLCAEKGFDAVEFDNVDGFSNDTGFGLRAANQLRYNRMLADEAKKAGLAVGLKNDLEQVAALVPRFDFALNESCFTLGECRLLKPFIDAKKPVYVIEYENGRATMDRHCAEAEKLGVQLIFKPHNLDGRLFRRCGTP